MTAAQFAEEKTTVILTRRIARHFWLAVLDAAFYIGAWNRGATRRARLYSWALRNASDVIYFDVPMTGRRAK